MSVIGRGDERVGLSEGAVRALLEEAFAGQELDGQSLLVLIPDGTRTAPIPLMFRLLYEVLGARVAGSTTSSPWAPTSP